MSSKNLATAQQPGPSVSNVLQVEPSTAYFPPPHATRSIRNTINLTNTSEHWLVYKVRSSYPERFMVKPNNGFAAPSCVTRLAITLKRTGDDLSTQSKRDRFRITAKRVKGSSHASSPPSGDAKKIFDTAEETVLDTDIWCNYGSEVPAGVNLTFYATDEMSEAGGVTPSAYHVSRSRDDLASPPTAERGGSQPASKVSFNPRSSQPAAGDAPSQPSTTEGGKSAQDALVNAQRVKESIQADIAALKLNEKDLKDKIAAGNAKTDSMTKEARELEELRSKVSRTNEVLAQKQADLRIAEGRAQAAGNAANQSTAAAAASAAALGATSLPTSGPQTANPSTKQSAPQPPDQTSGGGGGSGVYLSTVLLCMITAYMVGIAYRLYALKGSPPGDLSQLLPLEARELVQSVTGFWKNKLF